jgi:hypothetical protein
VACNEIYAPCPNVLILNHFFEGAATGIGGVVDTELVLAPCSEDLGAASATLQVLAQMLVYNEFEQRFFDQRAGTVLSFAPAWPTSIPVRARPATASRSSRSASPAQSPARHVSKVCKVRRMASAMASSACL